MKKVLAAAISIISFSLLATAVYAGGGPIYLAVDGFSNPELAHTRILRFYISPELPCKGTEVTVEFVDQKDGDWIMVGSPSQPYVMPSDPEPHIVNNVSVPMCSSYAKVGVKNLEDRVMDVKIKTPDGTEYTSAPITVHFDGIDYGGVIDENYPWLSQSSPSALPSISARSLPTPSMTSTPQPSSSDSLKGTVHNNVDDLPKKIEENSKNHEQLQEQFNQILTLLRSLFSLLQSNRVDTP